MRVGELLLCSVRDADGNDLGRVHDVRLVQDGPLRGANALLRLDALVVGGSPIGLRMGVVRGGLRGPWPLVPFLRWLERRCLVIPWSDVAGVADGVVTLAATAREERRRGEGLDP